MIQEPLTISRAEKADCDEIYTPSRAAPSI